MVFDLLTILTNGEDSVWVPGAEWNTRSDGSSSLMTSQGYGSTKEFPIGTILTDEGGTNWVATHAIRTGFHLEGIILEEEEPDESE